jgi:hypothetical protein
MAPRVALLAMGDGTARRGVKAPGYLDPRAEPYDARAVDALRRGSPSALLRLDPEEGRDLLVAGRAAWQVLAGAARSVEASVDAELLAEDARYGVCYVVASWPISGGLATPSDDTYTHCG